MAFTLDKLRPRKVANALRRRWFEARLSRVPLEQAPPLVSLGSDYGGWIIPEGRVGPDWVCYCVGAGADVGFDLELVRRYGATVRCIEPVEAFVERARAQTSGDPRLTVHHAAIAAHDGRVRMRENPDPRSGALSPTGLYMSERYVEVPGRSLPSLMAELGDAQAQLLKLDVEGGEYGLLPQLDLVAMGVEVFSVQLHHNGGVAAARRLIEHVRAQGFSPVASRPVVKLTFVRDPARP